MGNFVCPALDPWVSWFKSSFMFSKCDLIVLSKGFPAKISYKVVFQGRLSPEEKSQVREPCVEVLGVFPTLPLELFFAG